MEVQLTSDEAVAGASWVKRFLKSEMALKGLSYAGLALKLAEIGVVDDEHNLRNKINRGTFSAYFLLQCMNAMGESTIRVPSWEKFLLDFERKPRGKS
jgi:hypothetical protein